MQADVRHVAFRLFLSLSDLWDGLHRNSIDPTRKGIYLSREYLGGYVRVSAGPAGTQRLVIEWNETSRHLRVVRCDEWPSFESDLSATVAYVREKAREHGIVDMVDAAFVKACQEPEPARRTVVARH